MKIAIVDKCPGRVDYKKYFKFEFEVYHLCSEVKPKILKADVDLELHLLEPYDLVILVGSEAAKHIAKLTSVTGHAGILIDGKYICIINPAMLIFKPEGKADFERSVAKIHECIEGGLKSIVVEGDFKGISTVQELDTFLDLIESINPERIAVDTETSSLHPRDGYVLGISISYAVGQGVYITSDILEERHIERLQKLFLRCTCIFHNKKFDAKMLNYHFGFVFDKTEDTMCMHYVLDENGTHGLKDLAIKYTNFGDYDKELTEFKDSYCATHGMLKDDFSYDLIPFEIICRYAAIDTAATLTIYNKFIPIIEANPKLLWVYRNLLMAGTDFLTKMEEIGIPISRERMEAAGQYLDNELTRNKAELYSYPEIKLLEEEQGKIFNPASVPQLRKLLFDYLKLTPTGKLTGTGAISTDAEVLEELALEHPLPKALLWVRQLSKLRNTYITKILDGLDKDGRIRTGFNLIFTTSGRLSSSGKFNAQQIPRDDPIIKGCIVARPGYKIVSQDLATAEMYYAAVLSKDRNLMKVFQQKEDFHSSVAKMVFNLPCDAASVKELYPLDRQAAKAISFGILYGSGPQKVVDTVNSEGGNLTLEDAKEIIREYFNTFSGLKKWLNERKTFIEANGYTYSFFGRKRRLPNVFSKDKGVIAHEVRSGINSEVQSIASDVNLLASIDMQNLIEVSGMDARIFMLVHDSIVAEVRDEEVDIYCTTLRNFTQNDRGCSILNCPIGTDTDVGQDYSFGKFDKVYELKENCLSRIPNK